MLQKGLNAILSLNGPSCEVLVIDDGSSDETWNYLQEQARNHPNLKILQNTSSQGPAVARNKGLQHAKGEIAIIMDDDCIPSKEWLVQLVEPFDQNKKIAVTSSFGYYGGTSTAYRMDVFRKIGFFDEAFPANYREDTDTIFKILDAGFEVKVVKAPFEHIHPPPKGKWNRISYIVRRVWIHRFDPLLYKKHPSRGKEFFDVKWGFIRNPLQDFKAATGLWWSRKNFVLSSPQGIKFLENKSPVHALLIVLAGIAYMWLVKVPRLYGSFVYGKLLL